MPDGFKSRTLMSAEAEDRAGSAKGFVLSWGIPIAMVLSVNFLGLSAFASQALVIAALGWMGVACLLNFRRCGRVHCIFTGLWFLLGAALLLAGLTGALPLTNDQATLAANATFFGALVLWFLPERIWGKYWGKAPVASAPTRSHADREE